MKRKLKPSQILAKTTNRREYNALRYKFDWLILDCGICPMYKHCYVYTHRKHKHCQPDKTIERNWKSQRKTQWK